MEKQEKRSLKLIIFTAFLFSLGLSVGLNVLSDFLNYDDDTFPEIFYAFIYASGFVYGIVLFCIKMYKNKGINSYQLFVIKIMIGLLLLISYFIIDAPRFWNLPKNLYGFTLIDDREYFEDPSADDDPIWGSNSSGYNSTFMYLVHKEINLDSLTTPSGIIYNDEDELILIDKYGDIAYIHLSNAVFWQSAFVKGYIPLPKGQFNTKGFFNQVFRIAPLYLLELILTHIIPSSIFVVIVVIIHLRSPEYLFKRVEL